MKTMNAVEVKGRSQEELVKEFLSRPGEFAAFNKGMSKGEKLEFKKYLKGLRATV
jgi:hypothetical protein